MKSSDEMNAIYPVSEADSANRQVCFHCGEPVTTGEKFKVDFSGDARVLCCAGCQAVAQTIIDMGLEDYYHHRNALPQKPESLLPDELSTSLLLTKESIRKEFVRQVGEHLSEADLIIEGIVCPACAWLIESRLSSVKGIQESNVNYGDQRCHITWDEDIVSLKTIFDTIFALGYKAFPHTTTATQAVLEQEGRSLLRRLGLAGVLGMQIMMVAVALYQAQWTGMDLQYRRFFHWFSLLLCLPVLTYSGKVFFINALRDLKIRRLGMDVPVAIGIGIAFLGSVWNTITDQDQVYYESVAMFIFLLLLSRYLELSAKRKANQRLDSLNKLQPVSATRIEQDSSAETVTVAELKLGDVIRIRPGEVVPVDAEIIRGSSQLDESVINGESQPRYRSIGDEIVAGSTNINSTIECKVLHLGADMLIERVGNLVNQARQHKPRVSEIANRAASWFVGAVLIFTGLVTFYWFNSGARDWLPITISILVITCPCALALATPMAITNAIGNLLEHGVVLRDGRLLESLNRITHVIFDKTGTLTFGSPIITRIKSLSEWDQQRSLQLAASLELYSEHPLAKAFTEHELFNEHLQLDDVKNHPGRGLSCRLDGKEYYLGSSEFIQTATGLEGAMDEGRSEPEQGQHLVILADREQPHCLFYCQDAIRAEALPLVSWLQGRKKQVSILSGDQPDNVAKVANELSSDGFFAGLSAEDKLARISELQQQGGLVAMVGDGVNDAPTLAKAQVSVAMANGTNLAKNSADIILLHDSLKGLKYSFDLALRTKTIILQNIFWAISYNMLALPAAATGMVPPWLAALGMSISSLLVIFNSMRLNK